MTLIKQVSISVNDLHMQTRLISCMQVSRGTSRSSVLGELARLRSLYTALHAGSARMAFRPVMSYFRIHPTLRAQDLLMYSFHSERKHAVPSRHAGKAKSLNRNGNCPQSCIVRYIGS